MNGSRPNPHMLYKSLDDMNIAPINAVVKVDDSIEGINEGLNAGCWTVGMAKYSTYMNMNSVEEEETLDEHTMDLKLMKSRDVLSKAGAHYIIDRIEELPEIVADINAQLAKGNKP